MFSSLLGSLGGPLLSGLMGGGGGSGGSSSGGGSGGGFGSGISNALGGIFKTFAPLAGTAGTALGTYFGGPLGGMLGGSLGNAVGNMFGGGSQQQGQQQQGQQGQQMQQYGPQQSYGNQMGTSIGNAMNQGFNQFIPQQLQGQTFGNMGGALGGYLGGQFGHPNAGKMIGEMANPYIQQYMPQGMRDQQMGNFGGYLGQQAGQRFDQGMQNRGFNPSMGGGFGGGQQPYEAPGANSFGGNEEQVYGGPTAPPLQLDQRGWPVSQGNSYSGGNEEQAYGGPPAPPFDLGQRNGGSPSRSGFPPQSDARSNMLGEIRNFRRPASAPSQGNSYGNIPEAPPFDGGGYGNIPEAPPFGGGGGYGGGSQFPQQAPSRQNLLSEIRNFRRPGGAPTQGNGYSSPQSYPQGIPEAPPFDQSLRYSPGSAPTMNVPGIRSGTRLGLGSSMPSGGSGNIFDEIKRRGGQGHMGLRPTQTRASSAYPRDSSNDLMARMMAQRRGAIEPSDFRYQSGGQPYGG